MGAGTANPPLFLFYTSSLRMYLKERREKAMKVEIKKDTKVHNKFAVKMELTEGAILAQKHADSGSAVAADVLAFVWAAGEKAGIKF